eukprot:131510-Pyramimonas_sp.AAC.1
MCDVFPATVPDTQVDRVIASKGSGEGAEYLVKWQSQGYASSTWEDAQNLESEEDQAAVAKFEARRTPPTSRPKGKRGYEGDTPAFQGGRALRDYQVESFKWMTSNHKRGISCMLGDEMGLGKTAQSVAVMEHIRLNQTIQRPFLVRPRSL